MPSSRMMKKIEQKLVSVAGRCVNRADYYDTVLLRDDVMMAIVVE